MSFLKDPKVMDPLGVFDAYANDPEQAARVASLEAKEKARGKTRAIMPEEEQRRSAKRAALKKQTARRGRTSTIMNDTLG